jgi:hypothetical protein
MPIHQPDNKILKSWISRTIALFLAALVAGLAAANAFALITQVNRPDLALRVNPNNGQALSREAIRKFARIVQPEAFVSVRPMALAALRSEPLLPSALFVLGSIAEGNKRPDAADRIMQLSGALSRRDIATQLWLIERSINLNNVSNALLHYDVALRSNSKISGTLFPILLQAVSEPEIRRNLKPYFGTQSPWIPAFLNFAVTSRTNDRGIAQLLIEVGGKRDPVVYEPIHRALINQLTADGSVFLARDLYLSIAGSDRNNLQSTGFDPANIDPRFSPFAWDLSSSDAGEAFFKGQGQNQPPVLVVQLGPNQTTLFARKVTFLLPEKYHLSLQHPSNSDKNEAILLSPVVYCFEEKDGKMTINSANIASITNVNEATTITVSSSCPAQYISLKATSGTGQNFDESVISQVILEKASR